MEWEKIPWQQLQGPVVGVDEVGRGCLAGRVYAAAVILPTHLSIENLSREEKLSQNNLSKANLVRDGGLSVVFRKKIPKKLSKLSEKGDFGGGDYGEKGDFRDLVGEDLVGDRDYSAYTDSKLLSEKRREVLSKEIRTNYQYCIAFAEVEEIAELNILQASLLAMKRAVEGLNSEIGHILVDGKFSIPGLNLKQSAVVKGDLRAEPIGAAAIIAKVERDRYISKYSEEFPEYGFEKHKAYATKVHKEAIKKWGPLSIHRKDFAGVREHWHRLRV